MSRSGIAPETGMHSPWVIRLLSELGHEVTVAHARKVCLIVESHRKQDRFDARTLARLARIGRTFCGRCNSHSGRERDWSVHARH
jgi:transposase